MAYGDERPMSEEDYMMKAAEPRRSGLPLPEQDKCLAELQEVANLLLDKLNPVLTPTEPTDKASDERPVPVQSEVANILTDNNARIRRVTRRLSNAIERLEV